MEKYESKLNRHHLNKKIAKFVEALLKDSKRLRVTVTQSEMESLEDIELYVEAYMKEHHRFNGNPNFSDKIGKLYQHLFNKYEKVPFVNDMSGSNKTTPVNITVKQSPRGSILPQGRNASIRKSGKALERGKDLMGESFIKLRFFNNLRKEIKTLNQDTEAIISSEMNKFS